MSSSASQSFWACWPALHWNDTSQSHVCSSKLGAVSLQSKQQQYSVTAIVLEDVVRLMIVLLMIVVIRCIVVITTTAVSLQ